MPANDSIRLDHDQAIAPIGKPAADQDPEAAIGIAEPRSGLPALENDELLPKAEIFGGQSCFGLKYGGESIDKAPDHRIGL
jgi:hypothetical protein